MCIHVHTRTPSGPPVMSEQLDNCKRGHLTFPLGFRMFTCVHTEHDPAGRWLPMSVILDLVSVSFPGDTTDLRVGGASWPKRACSSWTWLTLVLVNMFLTAALIGQGIPCTNKRHTPTDSRKLSDAQDEEMASIIDKKDIVSTSSFLPP